MDYSHLAHQHAPEVFNARAATIAPLSRREKNPAAGEARRHKVADVLGVAGGLGSVVAVKSAATAMAMWVGAPALGIVAVGVVATMMAAGGASYVTQLMQRRSAMKRQGWEGDLPRFRFGEFAKSLVASKPALIAAAMSSVAVALPAAAMVILGSGVAAVGAGIHDYLSKRKEAKALGRDLGPVNMLDMFVSVFKSRNAHKAFGISAVLGTVISGAMMAFTGTSVDHTPGGSEASGIITPAVEFNAAAPAGAPAADVAASAPSAEVSAPAAIIEAPEDQYRVQRGDTLLEIAKQFSSPSASSEQIAQKMQEIVALNGIQNADYIQAGQTLALTSAGIETATIPAPAPAPVEPSVASAPLTPAPASVVTTDATDANGVRMLTYSNGIRETITPVYAAVADVPPAVEKAISAVSECLVTETETEIKMDCVLDPNATVQPGSGIDFRTAAEGESFRVSLSPTSAPMNAQEFLANHAVPEAEEAYSNGRFAPKP